MILIQSRWIWLIYGRCIGSAILESIKCMRMENNKVEACCLDEDGIAYFSSATPLEVSEIHRWSFGSKSQTVYALHNISLLIWKKATNVIRVYNIEAANRILQGHMSNSRLESNLLQTLPWILSEFRSQTIFLYMIFNYKTGQDVVNRGNLNPAGY